MSEDIEEFDKHRKKWMAVRPNPLFIVIEKSRIMDSWLAGKPVGAGE